ncbi:MAG: hypothetical protein QOD45_1669 [Pseudonocardiales bacterium]|nr:hypothetical protein [Pseudonocardiales bacterium]
MYVIGCAAGVRLLHRGDGRVCAVVSLLASLGLLVMCGAYLIAPPLLALAALVGYAIRRPADMSARLS